MTLTLNIASLLLPLAAITGTLSGEARRRAIRVDVWIVLGMLVIAAWGAAADVLPSSILLIQLALSLRVAGWLTSAYLAAAADVRWNPLVLGAIALAFHSVHLPRVLENPIDGDEPYYVLMAESLVSDGDLDLRNQYATLERSLIGRTDILPQPGDPVTASGAQRSRHEPFLSVLLIPGLLLGGLAGASLTIVVFAALLCWTTTHLLRELALPPHAVVAGTALILATAPLVSYSVRIWPEVPAAFFLAEATRWILRRRLFPASALLIAMSLLKLRFAVIAAPLLLLAALWRLDRSQRPRAFLVAMLALLLPMGLIWLVSGSPLNVHELSELLLLTPATIGRGVFGTLLDGQTGLLFVVPIVLVSLLAHLRQTTPAGSSELRLLALAALPYLILLAPRAEWYGGWSPPLRYLVVFAPLAAILVARAHAAGLDQWRAVAWLFSFAAALYAVLLPWRQFHVATGESHLGAFISQRLESDASRMFPSFIRHNDAATVSTVVLSLLVLALLLTRKRPAPERGAVILVLAVAVVAGAQARTPARTIHFEDTHVQKEGGALAPSLYTPARFLYEGGWRVDQGETVTFRARGTGGELRARSDAGAVIVLDDRRLEISPGDEWQEMQVSLDDSRPRHEIRVETGSVVLESLNVH